MSAEILNEEKIQGAIEFHGHSCPGLAIGIRASEAAMHEFGIRSLDEEIVAVIETNMCGVDAIQYLTGCTYGKGNLIHLDYGKKAFSFYRRSDKKGVRIALNASFFHKMADDMHALQTKRLTTGLSEEEEQRLKNIAKEKINLIMNADLQELFDIHEAPGPLPPKAKILESVTCAECGEAAMETKTRRFLGQTLCMPCFQKVNIDE